MALHRPGECEADIPSLVRMSLLLIAPWLLTSTLVPTPLAQTRDPHALRAFEHECSSLGRVTTAPDAPVVLGVGLASWPLPGAARGASVATRDWVEAHADAFGLEPNHDALVLDDEQGLAEGARRVTLRQTHDGLSVIGADLRAVVDGTGHLRSLLSGLSRGPWPSARVGVGPEVASRRVREALPDLEPGTTTTTLAWYAGDEVPRLVWWVQGRTLAGREVRCWVAASDGVALAMDVGVAHALGHYFPSDPSGLLRDVVLPELATGPGLGSLWAKVEDLVVRPIVPFAADDYRYPPTDSMFDQVNAYALTDHYLRDELRGRLGWTGPHEPFVVRTHYPTSPYAAVTSGRFVHLSDAIPGFVREVPRAADIVDHELTHAMIYDHGIQPTGPGREAGALHEGLADYFAAVLTNDVRIGEWLYPNFPDGATRVDRPLPQWSVANYDRVGYNGGEIGSVWGNGMILSSTLWDLRQVLGTTTDSLVLESLDYLPSQPTWVMFGNALLQADADHHGDRHVSDILRVLQRRGWRGGIVAAGFLGPDSVTAGQEAHFVATPCSGEVGRCRDLWMIREWCRGAPCEPWRPAGEGDSLVLTMQHDTEIGLHVISIWGDTVVALPRFVSVDTPSLSVHGPSRVVQGVESRWRADVVARGPYQVYWSLRLDQAGATEVPVGSGLELRQRLSHASILRVSVQDVLGRIHQRSLSIAVDPERAIAPPIGALKLVQAPSFDGHMTETRIEVPETERIELRVFDVRGVARRRLADAILTRGAHVMRWSCEGLEPGLYLVSATAHGMRSTARLTVLR